MIVLMSEDQSTENVEDRPKSRRFDSRHLRSERTRRLMIEAYLGTAREEHGRLPTANRLPTLRANRCGRSSSASPISLLWALRRQQFAIAAGQAQAPAQNVDGDRRTRIASHVHIRAQACERWLPLWRILTSPATQTQLAELAIRAKAVRRANVERLELMHRPELASLDSPQREQLSWSRWRR